MPAGGGVSEELCVGDRIAKVQALMGAAAEVESLLVGGATRREIGCRVSAAGKRRFWDRWPE